MSFFGPFVPTYKPASRAPAAASSKATHGGHGQQQPFSIDAGSMQPSHSKRVAHDGVFRLSQPSNLDSDAGRTLETASQHQILPPEPTPPQSGHKDIVVPQHEMNAYTAMDRRQSERRSRKSDTLGSSSRQRQARHSHASQASLEAADPQRQATLRRARHEQQEVRARRTQEWDASSDEERKRVSSRHSQMEESERRRRALEWDDSSDEEQEKTSRNRANPAARLPASSQFLGAPDNSRQYRSQSSSATSTSSTSSSKHAYQNVPIRDTPNNPFLVGNWLQGVDKPGREASRGEDAARAHRRGLITYVFRGQRIVYADAPSDLEEEEEDLMQPDGTMRPRYRFQPKLLFPEAHAQEQRRRRRHEAVMAAQAGSHRPLAPLRRGDSLRGLADHLGEGRSSMSASASMSSLPSTANTSRNLFAAEEQRRQIAQRNQRPRQSLSKRQREEEANANGDRHIFAADEMSDPRGGHDVASKDAQRGPASWWAAAARNQMSTSRSTRQLEQHHHSDLLAQLDRAGWHSSDEEHPDEDEYEVDPYEEEVEPDETLRQTPIDAELSAARRSDDSDEDDFDAAYEVPTRRGANGLQSQPQQQRFMGDQGYTSRPTVARTASGNPFDLDHLTMG